MAAAACCITAFREGKVRLELTRIYHPAAAPVDSGNAVLIIPGTGVGLGAVVAPAPAGPPALPLHISCEIQHTDAARLPEQFGTLAGLMQKRLGRDKLSWEDFVSGRGLVNMHACLADHRAAEDGPDAGEIARRAVAGTEAASVTALACYYHVCGALAQVMALSFQPSAGIFLGGSTTRQNRRFIEQSGFVRACQDNSVRGELLASFPVYLVPEYMNLNGAMYLAQQSMHA